MRLNFLQPRMTDDRAPARFTDNFIRLLGLHALSQHFTAQLLGVSAATMSAWMNGKSTPSLAKAIDIAELFQISTDRLMGAEFWTCSPRSSQTPSGSSTSSNASNAAAPGSAPYERRRLGDPPRRRAHSVRPRRRTIQVGLEQDRRATRMAGGRTKRRPTPPRDSNARGVGETIESRVARRRRLRRRVTSTPKPETAKRAS